MNLGSLSAFSAPQDLSAFVYRPGGTAGNGIFTTWASFVSALAAVNGVRLGVIDSSLAAAGALGIPAALIPAGAWDFNPNGAGQGIVYLVGTTSLAASPSCLQTTIGAAVSINGCGGFTDLFIDNRSSLDLFTMAGANATFRITGLGATVASQDVSASGAFLKCATSGNILLQQNASIQSLTGGTNAIQVTAGTVLLFVTGTALVGASQVQKTGGTYSVFIDTFATYATQVSAATPSSFNGGVQRGVTTLSSGVSPAITARIAATSRIVFGLNAPANDALTVKYAALSTDRSNGVAGSFKISALTAAGSGAINTADTSIMDWMVVTG